MEATIVNQDYSFRALPAAPFSHLRFKDVAFFQADLRGSDFSNCLFENCDFSFANLQNVNFEGADLRGCSLYGADIRGANLFFAMLEKADLREIIHDETTQFFALHCPETGPFLGYKKCFGNRIVQLLIPANARRTSATNTCCRCDFAKVLTIKDMETNEDYDEAVSYVDQDFIYRRGQLIYAKNFNPDRWADSTGGIHFWLTRKEAEGYM